MTNISKLSDFEKNKRIAEIEYPDATHIGMDTQGYPPKVLGKPDLEKLYRDLNPEKFKDSVILVLHGDLAKTVDYCNSDADAFKLIHKYEIDITWVGVPGESDCNASGQVGDSCIESTNKNPCRAIVECVLMMHGDK